MEDYRKGKEVNPEIIFLVALPSPALSAAGDLSGSVNIFAAFFLLTKRNVIPCKVQETCRCIRAICQIILQSHTLIFQLELGTTNSLAAYFTEEGPRIIPNRLGKRLTPSVVSIDDKEQIYVGDLAVERALLYPGSAASVFKRDMGSDRKFTLLNKTFRAEELASFVLRA